MRFARASAYDSRNSITSISNAAFAVEPVAVRAAR